MMHPRFCPCCCCCHRLCAQGQLHEGNSPHLQSIHHQRTCVLRHRTLLFNLQRHANKPCIQKHPALLLMGHCLTGPFSW